LHTNEIFSFPSSLSLLAFGREFMYIDRLQSQIDDGPQRQCFVRSQLLNTKIPGVATAAAVPIERKLVKYVVPEYDLLDYKFDYGP